MSWSRGGLNSPSMASVLGSAAHAIPTTHAPSPDYVTDKKRKNGARDEARAPAQKRLKPKPMGRPRNGWTPTRKRKLVRLYLMTDLNVGEIAEVLRSKHFQPWYSLLPPIQRLLLTCSCSKRDIQTQCRSNLQLELALTNKCRNSGNFAPKPPKSSQSEGTYHQGETPTPQRMQNIAVGRTNEKGEPHRSIQYHFQRKIPIRKLRAVVRVHHRTCHQLLARFRP